MPEDSNPFKKKIEGKIASIVTIKHVVINRGTKDGVKEGMRFSVRLNIGTIEDPDDPSNIMEDLSFEKAKIRVTTVYDRMSYCVIRGTPINPFASMLGVGEQAYPPIGDMELISEADWRLRRGDHIEEITEGDEEKD